MKLVESTTLDLLGAEKFLEKTKAKVLPSILEGVLILKLPKKAANKANIIKIELVSDTLFDISFYENNPRKYEINLINKLHNVSSSSLRGVFTQETGIDVY